MKPHSSHYQGPGGTCLECKAELMVGTHLTREGWAVCPYSDERNCGGQREDNGQEADAAPAELVTRSAPASLFRVIEVEDGRFDVSASGLDRDGLIDLDHAIRRILKPGKAVALPKDDKGWMKGGGNG